MTPRDPSDQPELFSLRSDGSERGSEEGQSGGSGKKQPSYRFSNMAKKASKKASKKSAKKAVKKSAKKATPRASKKSAGAKKTARKRATSKKQLSEDELDELLPLRKAVKASGGGSGIKKPPVDLPTGPDGEGPDGHGGSYHVHEMYGDWFLDYASYVILERAVPHMDDGFKPVQRRILTTMFEMNDGRPKPPYCSSTPNEINPASRSLS